MPTAALPTDFNFRYENYVVSTPRPEVMQVTCLNGTAPMLHLDSCLWPSHRGAVPLEVQDFAALVQLVTQEVRFWEPPGRILGGEPVDGGDTPAFTLRLQGREHSSAGACAGYWHPGIAQLQAAMLHLYEKYLLPCLLPLR